MSMKALYFRLFSIVAVLLLAGCATGSDSPSVQVDDPQAVIKSPADDRDYRALTLENGLKVMLVSDPDADQAAAALDVYVGSGNDPKDREGLAHYLEHMLFLGTEKYPESGEYQQYITSHGGSNNAYTVINHTNYFFSVTPEYLEGGLDRFAQFFIGPLFNASYVTRERAIVDSEYQARKDDESRRLWTARKVVYNPEHPVTQFSVGSLDTLADRDNDSVREDLVAFYKRYYHASRMALSVVGNQSLDQLQAWVEEKFSAIPDGGEEYAPFSQQLVLSDKLPVQLTLKPIKETRSVTFSFPIDSLQPDTDSKPGQYLSNLLGHEGEGSLLAVLKERVWANGLSAGVGYSDDVQATFDVKISLSESGLENVDEIGTLLFAEIELIREQGVRKNYFEEQKKLADIDFRFQEKSSESGLVQGIASRLHRYPAQEVLSLPYRFKRYAPDRIEAILERLNVENLQLILVDPELESSQKTDWYNVAYEIADINPDWIDVWRDATPVAALMLPAANLFIPDQLKLLDAPAQPMLMPVKLDAPSGVDIWYQTRVDFKQPKAEIYFTLRSAVANGSPRQAMLTELYVKAVEEALGTYTYPAYLAGLEYQIYRHSRGVSVRISGYSEKQSQLLAQIVSTMQSLDVDPHRFELYTTNIRRKLENSLKGRPSDRVVAGIYDVLLTSSWSAQEKLAALKGIDLAALKAHAAYLLQQPELMLLAVGNVSEQDSFRAGEVVSQLNPGGAAPAVKRAQVRRLNSGRWTLQNTPSIQADSAIVLVYQGKSAAIDELAATQLLGSLIRTPYYQALRTEAQVGYIVSAFAFNILDTPGLGFMVQSNSNPVGELVQRTRKFVTAYAQGLAALPDETFASTKAGLIARLTQEDKQLAEVASRDWGELDRRAYDFDTRERLVAAIKALDKVALQAHFLALTADDNAGAILSYSLGKLSSKPGLPDDLNVISYDSIDDVRHSLQRYFHTPPE